MFICMILIVTILIGCAHSVNQLSFVATVLENDETYLLVKPEEGSDELRSADRITVSIRDTVLLNSQDIEIAADDIAIGKQVEIAYDGTIAESYPAQINQCSRVRLLD
ncbi:MAG: DUF3221 domain-containing protein [Syntrophaceticus sp.]